MISYNDFFFSAKEKNKFLLTELTINLELKKKMEDILKISQGIIS